ncbi:DNA methyltransferase [Streptantibioticus silvisoli]|uniref:DNA methyltransferase n=1 Tax=Streptantibioticus silvisoli TaxID=2705255 RepID=A0ABT6W2X7_9ACTN|nr:DNA methyltransferase [Streptantibioticus silvisoli]MDI5964038.1 DNA methyltransferase [Streptantibioticus silvisoli]
MTALGSVWATGQTSPRGQLRQGPYISATVHDADRVPPAVARLAIDHLTAAGDTVLDPGCGAGTVIVEALRAGRNAIGITDDRRWWSVARANITATRRRTDAHTDALLLDGTPRRAAGQLTGMTGTVDLLLAGLRPTPALAPADALRRTLAHCLPLLRPGAHAAVVLRTTHDGPNFTDPIDDAARAGQDAGLLLVDHCIALAGQLRGDRLIPPPARQFRSPSTGSLGAEFHDVLIFRVPDRPLASAATRRLPRVRSTKPPSRTATTLREIACAA